MVYRGSSYPIARAPSGVDLKTEPDRAYDVSAHTARFIVDECVTKYWEQPGYVRIKDRPYLSLYNGAPPVSGQSENDFRDFVYEVRDYAQRHYKIEPYLVGTSWRSHKAHDLMDAISDYALLPNFFFEPGQHIQQYEDLIATLPAQWQKIASGVAVPFVPPVVLGWDATPRCAPDRSFEEVIGKYPHTPVVVGSTPEKAADLLRDTLEWVTKHVPHDERYGIITAWNELSEGTALVPPVKDGKPDFSYARTIGAVLKDRRFPPRA